MQGYWVEGIPSDTSFLHSKSKLITLENSFFRTTYFEKELFWSAFLPRQAHLMRILPYSNTQTSIGSNLIAADRATFCKKKLAYSFLWQVVLKGNLFKNKIFTIHSYIFWAKLNAVDISFDRDTLKNKRKILVYTCIKGYVAIFHWINYSFVKSKIHFS